MTRTIARSLLVALMLGASAWAVAADDASLRVVDACRARLDVNDIGIERIQKRCPELLPALASAPWRDLVPTTLRERREELSAASLAALAELVRRADETTNAGAAPDVATLAPVLKELGEQGQAGATRWERFKRWLQKIRDSGDSSDEGFLARWSRELTTSEGVARAISYIAYAMLGALVLFVIASEIRAAGLFRTRRATARLTPEAAWRRRLLLEDVAAAPLAERPGMLLRLLGEALVRARRLPAADGLTAGAIARRAQLDSDADRDELARVAQTSDEIRYADRVPPPETLEESVARARALLAKVAAPGARR